MSHHLYPNVPEGKTMEEYLADLHEEQTRGKEEIERMIAECQSLNGARFQQELEEHARQMEMTALDER